MVLDFRDTKYWGMMSTEEQENYVYVLNKWNHAQSEVEFAIAGKLDVTPLGLGDLLDILVRVYSDLIEYEKTLLLKYRA